MTNQEWLLTLKPNDCALFCLKYLPQIGRSYSEARYGVATWLEKEYIGDIDYAIREFYQLIKLEKLFSNKGENNE